MQARVMFEAAADMGDPGGQVALAYMHMYGLGTPVNATAARLAYEAAAAVDISMCRQSSMLDYVILIFMTTLL